MLIRFELKPDDAGRIDLDNHTLNRGHFFIAGQRILPGLKLRMPNPGIDQIHFADSALVLLKRRNLF